MPSPILTESIGLELGGQEPWPTDVKLYQPYEVEQVLLPDNANCLAVQAYLKMCGLPFEVESRANAEFMSPSGHVPFIKCGQYVVADLDAIVTFVENKGISLTSKLDEAQKSDMKAYMSLINYVLGNSELYVCWLDNETYNTVTKQRYGSVFPWPLNHVQTRAKRATVAKYLKSVRFSEKSLEEVYQDVETCCRSLSDRLDGKEYFFGAKPTELDALMFGHMFSLRTMDLHQRNRLPDIVDGHDLLLTHCRKIYKVYFGRDHPLHATPKNLATVSGVVSIAGPAMMSELNITEQRGTLLEEKQKIFVPKSQEVLVDKNISLIDIQPEAIESQNKAQVNIEDEDAIAVGSIQAVQSLDSDIDDRNNKIEEMKGKAEIHPNAINHDAMHPSGRLQGQTVSGAIGIQSVQNLDSINNDLSNEITSNVAGTANASEFPTKLRVLNTENEKLDESTENEIQTSLSIQVTESEVVSKVMMNTDENVRRGSLSMNKKETDVQNEEIFEVPTDVDTSLELSEPSASKVSKTIDQTIMEESIEVRNEDSLGLRICIDKSSKLSELYHTPREENLETETEEISVKLFNNYVESGAEINRNNVSSTGVVEFEINGPFQFEEDFTSAEGKESVVCSLEEKEDNSKITENVDDDDLNVRVGSRENINLKTSEPLHVSDNLVSTGYKVSFAMDSLESGKNRSSVSAVIDKNDVTEKSTYSDTYEQGSSNGNIGVQVSERLIDKNLSDIAENRKEFELGWGKSVDNSSNYAKMNKTAESEISNGSSLQVSNVSLEIEHLYSEKNPHLKSSEPFLYKNTAADVEYSNDFEWGMLKMRESGSNRSEANDTESINNFTGSACQTTSVERYWGLVGTFNEESTDLKISQPFLLKDTATIPSKMEDSLESDESITEKNVSLSRLKQWKPSEDDGSSTDLVDFDKKVNEITAIPEPFKFNRLTMRENISEMNDNDAEISVEDKGRFRSSTSQRMNEIEQFDSEEHRETTSIPGTDIAIKVERNESSSIKLWTERSNIIKVIDSIETSVDSNSQPTSLNLFNDTLRKEQAVGVNKGDTLKDTVEVMVTDELDFTDDEIIYSGLLGIESTDNSPKRSMDFLENLDVINMDTVETLKTKPSTSRSLSEIKEFGNEERSETIDFPIQGVAVEQELNNNIDIRVESDTLNDMVGVITNIQHHVTGEHKFDEENSIVTEDISSNIKKTMDLDIDQGTAKIDRFETNSCESENVVKEDVNVIPKQDVLKKESDGNLADITTNLNDAEDKQFYFGQNSRSFGTKNTAKNNNNVSETGSDWIRSIGISIVNPGTDSGVVPIESMNSIDSEKNDEEAEQQVHAVARPIRSPSLRDPTSVPKHHPSYSSTTRQKSLPRDRKSSQQDRAMAQGVHPYQRSQLALKSSERGQSIDAIIREVGQSELAAAKRLVSIHNDPNYHQTLSNADIVEKMMQNITQAPIDETVELGSDLQAHEQINVDERIRSVGRREMLEAKRLRAEHDSQHAWDREEVEENEENSLKKTDSKLNRDNKTRSVSKVEIGRESSSKSVDHESSKFINTFDDEVLRAMQKLKDLEEQQTQIPLAPHNFQDTLTESAESVITLSDVNLKDDLPYEFDKIPIEEKQPTVPIHNMPQPSPNMIAPPTVQLHFELEKALDILENKKMGLNENEEGEILFKNNSNSENILSGKSEDKSCPKLNATMKDVDKEQVRFRNNPEMDKYFIKENVEPSTYSSENISFLSSRQNSVSNDSPSSPTSTSTPVRKSSLERISESIKFKQAPDSEARTKITSNNKEAEENVEEIAVCKMLVPYCSKGPDIAGPLPPYHDGDEIPVQLTSNSTRLSEEIGDERKDSEDVTSVLPKTTNYNELIPYDLLNSGNSPPSLLIHKELEYALRRFDEFISSQVKNNNWHCDTVKQTPNSEHLENRNNKVLEQLNPPRNLDGLPIFPQIQSNEKLNKDIIDVPLDENYRKNKDKLIMYQTKNKNTLEKRAQIDTNAKKLNSYNEKKDGDINIQKVTEINSQVKEEMNSAGSFIDTQVKQFYEDICSSVDFHNLNSPYPPVEFSNILDVINSTRPSPSEKIHKFIAPLVSSEVIKEKGLNNNDFSLSSVVEDDIFTSYKFDNTIINQKLCCKKRKLLEDEIIPEVNESFCKNREESAYNNLGDYSYPYSSDALELLPDFSTCSEPYKYDSSDTWNSIVMSSFSFSEESKLPKKYMEHNALLDLEKSQRFIESPRRVDSETNKLSKNLNINYIYHSSIYDDLTISKTQKLSPSETFPVNTPSLPSPELSNAASETPCSSQSDSKTFLYLPPLPMSHCSESDQLIEVDAFCTDTDGNTFLKNWLHDVDETRVNINETETNQETVCNCSSGKANFFTRLKRKLNRRKKKNKHCQKCASANLIDDLPTSSELLTMLETDSTQWMI